MLTNRGLKAWPGKAPTCAFSSLWALRIMADDVGADLPAETVAGLHAVLAKAGLDIASVETLFHYNDKPGYTAAQGE
jgi:isocitrate dehydrogenase